MTPEPDRPPIDAADTPGFVQALGILRERWWVVLICTAVCAIAAFAYVGHLPKHYTATARLQFANSSVPSEVAGVPQPQAVDPEGEKATYLQLVTTTPVAELVAKALKLHETPAELLEEVTATNPNSDYIIDVTATSTSATRAAAIANGFAQQYTVYSRTQNEAQLISGEELINHKLAELPATDAVDRANLRTLYQKLLLLQAVQTANAHVVNVAATPSSPSSPKVTTTVLIALVVGLLIGVGLVFLVNLLDRRVKSLEELETLYGLSAMAAVPRLPRRARTERQREAALEPFRILHNALAVVRRANRVNSVLITSAVSNEGKTTVALGLARAATDAGQRVILVEADLRHPSLSEHLQLADGDNGGLAAALLAGEDPIRLLSTPLTGPENLQILTSGTIPSHAIDLLNSESLASVFSALSSHADLVVIDSAPLLPVADTRMLLDRVAIDACLIVGRLSVTTKDQVRRARTVLRQRRLQDVGLVVDDTTNGAGDYYYGHARGAPPGTPVGGAVLH
ncbi:MAG: GNVR domain-containing protein, partial [Solirubrobacteraceae bacterium]